MPAASYARNFFGWAQEIQQRRLILQASPLLADRGLSRRRVELFWTRLLERERRAKAWQECFRAVLIEAEPEYQEDIRRRMLMAAMGPDERKRYEIKLRDGNQQPEMYPLSEAA